MDHWKVESGRTKSWVAFLVAMTALVLAVGHEAVTFFATKQQEQARIAARLDLPKTADFWNVSAANLEYESGALVVYSDGHALEAFEGRYKVAVRNGKTFRHAWTPEWSVWIDYARNPDGTRYDQPEALEWWAGIADASLRLDPSEPWVMETCWQARVNDPVLGLTELEPVCVSDDLAGQMRPQYLGE